jgi:hypothetical protein
MKLLNYKTIFGTKLPRNRCQNEGSFSGFFTGITSGGGAG